MSDSFFLEHLDLTETVAQDERPFLPRCARSRFSLYCNVVQPRPERDADGLVAALPEANSENRRTNFL